MSLWDKLMGTGAAQPAQHSGVDSLEAAPDTLALRAKHTKEYTEGRTDLPFVEWLEQNGRQMGTDNQVRYASPDAAAQPAAQPSGNPPTPSFLYRGREQAR